MKIFCGLYPHPVSAIRLGISGNIANVNGLRLEQFMAYGILFRLLCLQVLGEPIPIKDNHLVKYSVPVPVTLYPFFDHIPTGRIEHFSSAVSLGNTLFVFVTFRYWRLSPSMIFVVYISSENWKKELTSFQLFSQLLTA